MSDWFNVLRRMLGWRDRVEPTPEAPKAADSVAAPGPDEIQEAPEQVKKRIPRKASRKLSTGTNRSVEHLIVVGLDFGTAYTKCVVRDALVRSPGKAFPVPFHLAEGWSYLVPSVVVKKARGLKSAFDGPLAESDDRIDYLKMRLVSEVDQRRGGAWKHEESPQEMQMLVAWFLAQVLARVGEEIHRRWAGFGEHPNDGCFINICVPIAHADGSRVEQCLLDALCAAQSVLGLAGTLPPSPERIRDALKDGTALQNARDYCYSYPETSANLQSYLKSRAREPGLYLFADVGAGTVDLTFFQLMRDSGTEAPLRYYHASVLEAGSSRLELKARESDPELSLLKLIAAKEGRSRTTDQRLLRALDAAREAIHREVATGVGEGVKATEAKLHRDPRYQRSQMKRIRLMHSGGGYSPDPYGRATQFFYRHRQWEPVPELRSLPEPDDLVWSNKGKKLPFARLSVAYGLAFARYELDGHRFPSETAVNPDSPLPAHMDRPSAPTKDEV